MMDFEYSLLGKNYSSSPSGTMIEKLRLKMFREKSRNVWIVIFLWAHVFSFLIWPISFF